jgi:cellobiose phosphorylase
MSEQSDHETESQKMIKKLKKQHEKEQALWEIRHDYRRFENSIIIEEVYETSYFNDNAT